LKTIQWDVETGDPDPSITAVDIIKTVNRKAQGGSIIIMHMNGGGFHTAEALFSVIANLRAQGYELVTVSELMSEEYVGTQII
jgi:peptidoglycan/xylan/chitin deacetylase (PgdA/CDA1 family)